MEVHVSDHAAERMKGRGVSRNTLSLLLDNADIEREAGDNCLLYRISNHAAKALGDERLARIAAVVSDDRVVTVIHIRSGKAGAAYSRRSRTAPRARPTRRTLASGRRRARANSWNRAGGGL